MPWKMRPRCRSYPWNWKTGAIPNLRIQLSGSSSDYGTIGHSLETIGERSGLTTDLRRINKELKRRSRVVGAFPSDQSFMRLGVSILMNIDEEWMTAKRYLSMSVD